jgi:ABC-type bacteriocin/lantibiotic exporter with double-glycine peptidase domain
MLNYIKDIKIILGKDFNKLWAASLLFLLLSSLEIMSISLIYPFVSIIVDPSKFISGSIYSFINKYYQINDIDHIFKLAGLTLIILFTIKAFVGIFTNRMIINFGLKQGIKLRAELMRSYQGIEYINFTQRNSSEYIYNIFHLANQYSQTVLVSLLKILSEGIVMIVILLVLAISNISVFLILVTILIIIFFLFDSIFKKKLNNYGFQTNKESNNMVKFISEAMNGIKTIRILGISDFFYNNLVNTSKKYAKVNLNQLTISQSPKYIIEAAIIYFLVLVFFLSFIIFNESENMIPILSMFGIAAIRLIPSFNQLLSCFSHLRFCRDGISLLTKDIVKLRTDEREKKNNYSVNKSINQIKKFEVLELKNISFAYNDKSKINLDNISIKIKKNEFIGVMGPSGSGKTTLIDIMLGLLNPNKGQILINNTSTKEVGIFLKSKMAYLPQQAFIVDGSIKDNVALGFLNDEINEKKVYDSLDKAQIGSTVSEMIDGINTQIGENGVKLSGGQKQRIALARAFYHEREVLILDESTSALDEKIEEEIINELKMLKKNITLIIISHRPSTLKYCDKILEIKNGKLFENQK